MKSINDILILSPHTDDAEFGCGGLISKFREMRANVYVMVFSLCEQSVPIYLPKDILEEELYTSMEVFKIREGFIFTESIPVRIFPEKRQEILDRMIQLKKDINPDLVLMPSLKDTHQDHNVVSNEGFRAFKGTSILGYEMPWNNLSLDTTTFCVLEKRHVEMKIKAMEMYKSQAFRPYSNREIILSLAKVRGLQCNREYAEVFETYRWFF